MVKEGGMTKRTVLGWVVFGVVLLVLTGVESCYFLNEASIVRRYAGLAWIIISASFLLVVAIRAFSTFCKRWFWQDKDRFWYLAAFFLPIALVYVDVAGVTWTRINDEGVQQVAQGLSLLKQDPDFGIYRLTYFIGFVARQYLLACLPTYFFGPSLVALRVGTTFVYLVSYLAFLAALANYLKVRGASNPLLLASFAGMMVTLGEYPLVNARLFEQQVMPIGATLLFLAGIFNFLIGPTPFRIFWVAWAFGYFAEGYSPALGAWWMALFVLLYLILHPKCRHWILGIPLVYGAICLLVACLLLNSADTLVGRFQIEAPHFTPSDWLWRYFVGYHTLLSAASSLLPGPLGLAIMAVLYFSCRFRDYRFPLLCFWCLGIVFVSLTFVGSNFNLPQYNIQRSMFILPPLAAGVVLFYHVYSPRLDPSLWAHKTVVLCSCCAMVYMICTSIAIPFTVRNYIFYEDISDYDEALYKIDCVNHDPKMQKVKKLYIVPPLRIDNLETGLDYFSPSAVIVRSNPPPGEKEAGTYLLSYGSDKEEDRMYDPIVPSLHPRPYLQLKAE